MSVLGNVIAGTRLHLFRLIASVLDRIEPRDPAHLASELARQLDRGAIVWRAFVDAGAALRRCERFDEADAMIERGLGAFPDDRTLLFEYAMSAHNSGRYATAIVRWDRALRFAPDLAMCHCGLAANLRETGCLERARETIGAAMQLFPDDLIVVSEAARIADSRGVFDEALPLWKRAAASANPPPEWVQGQAHALVRLERYGEAEAALAAGRLRFPRAPGLMAVEGLLASERGEWPKAVALWTAYRRRFPDDEIGRDQLEMAERASRRAAAEAGPDESAPEAPTAARGDLRALLLRFESIGDNCEFGAVQRRCAAEPPGLLRWSSLTLDALVAALGQRFAGMGDPTNAELSCHTSGEYIVTDRRWDLAVHTFRFAGQADRDRLFGHMCRKIAALKKQLIADLTTAEKIFVYRSEGVDGDGLERLHRALRDFGPVRLLSVQPAAPTAPEQFQGRAGDLLEVGENRYVGFVERLGVEEKGVWNVSLEDWISVCRRTVAA